MESDLGKPDLGHTQTNFKWFVAAHFKHVHCLLSHHRIAWKEKLISRTEKNPAENTSNLLQNCPLLKG